MFFKKKADFCKIDLDFLFLSVYFQLFSWWYFDRNAIKKDCTEIENHENQIRLGLGMAKANIMTLVELAPFFLSSPQTTIHYQITEDTIYGGGRKIADIRCQTKRQSTLSQWLLKGQIKKGGYEYVNTMFSWTFFEIGIDSPHSIAISAFYLDVNIMWKLGHFPQTIYSRFAELESPINILLPEIKTYWEKHSGGQLSLYFCHYSNNKDFLMLFFFGMKICGKKHAIGCQEKNRIGEAVNMDG